MPVRQLGRMTPPAPNSTHNQLGGKQGPRCTGSLPTAGPHPGRRPTGAFRRQRQQCFASRRGSGNTPLPSLLAAAGSGAQVAPAGRQRNAPGAVPRATVALPRREPLGSGTPAEGNPRPQRRRMATARLLPAPNCQSPMYAQRPAPDGRHGRLRIYSWPRGVGFYHATPQEPSDVCILPVPPWLG